VGADGSAGSPERQPPVESQCVAGSTADRPLQPVFFVNRIFLILFIRKPDSSQFVTMLTLFLENKVNLIKTAPSYSKLKNAIVNREGRF
jgi:hypothetical protein